jgi:hypothetical protein
MRAPPAAEVDVTPYERPDLPAVADLEKVIRHVTEELAGWRRRSLKAEGELQEAKASGGVVAGVALREARQRVIDLETENQALRQRIDGARERLRVLSSRLAFLEHHGGGNAA